MEDAAEAGGATRRPTREDQGGLTGGRVWRLRPILLVLLVAAGAWAYQHFSAGSRLSFDGMRALVEAHAPYSPLVFIGVSIAGIFLRVPSIMLVALGGILFKRPYAFAYSWVAAVVGTSLTFLLMRYLAREALQRSLISRFARLRTFDERLERHGFATILVLRLLLFLAPPLNWAIGATRVRALDYVGGTALGVIPGIAVVVFFANSIANQRPGDTLLNTETLVGAVLVAVLLIVATIAGRRLLGTSQGTLPGESMILSTRSMQPIPLTALDYLILMAERRSQRAGLPGVQGQIHVNFRGRIDMSQLQAAADRVAARWPLITARLAPAPRAEWVPTGAERWPVRQQTLDSDADPDLLRAIFQLAAEPVDLEREDPVRLIVLHRPGGDDVLTMNFTHVLLDGHGATGLLRQLLDPTRIPPASDTEEPPMDEIARILGRMPGRDRRRAVRRMLQLGRQVRPVTLPLLEKRQLTTPARITLRWIDEAGAAAIRERLERLGPIANLLLAVLASGCRTLSRHIPGPLGSRSGYRMVLHYDLRRGPQKRLIFQNLAGRIVLAARPADLADKDGLIRMFASQARTQIAEKTSLAVLQVAEILRKVDRWAPWLTGIRPPQSSVHGSTWGDLAESGRTVFGATVDHSWFTVFFLPQFSNVNVALNLVKAGPRYRVIFMHSPFHLTDEQASHFLDEWLEDLCRP